MCSRQSKRLRMALRPAVCAPTRNAGPARVRMRRRLAVAFIAITAVVVLALAVCSRSNSSGIGGSSSTVRSIGYLVRDTAPQRVCASELGRKFAAILAPSAASWGLLVHASQAGGEIYRHDAETSFVPASNMKLLIAAVALSRLTSSYRFETRTYPASAAASAAASAVCLLPAADPSFDDSALDSLVARTLGALDLPRGASVEVRVAGVGGAEAAPSTWESSDLAEAYGAQPAPLVLNGNTVVVRVSPMGVGSTLRAQVVSPRDSGLVLVDVRESVTIAAAQRGAPPVNAGVSLGYALNERGALVLNVRGSLPAGSPPQDFDVAVRPTVRHFAAHLKDSLAKRGSSLGRRPRIRMRRRDDASGSGGCGGARMRGAPPLAAAASAPLKDLLNHTLQVSDNLYAESILLAMGLATPARGGARGGLDKSAVLAATTTLDALLRTESALAIGPRAPAVSPAAAPNGNGVAATSGVLAGLRIADGSGLSRHNLVTPRLLVALLEAMRTTELRSIMPVAGRTGTLKYRMRNTAAEGRVFAKTGTMTGVSTLAGYMQHPTLGMTTFSFMANNAAGDVSQLKATEDALLVALAEATREQVRSTC